MLKELYQHSLIALGVGVDLSAGVRERNDYTVFVMGGRVGDKIYIIDCKRLRIMGNVEKLEAINGNDGWNGE